MDEQDERNAAGVQVNRRRVLKRLMGIGFAASICLFLLAITGIYDISAPYRYKWQLKDRLAQVDTLEKAELAAGSLGVALDHGDGQWTVIAYKDAHNFGHPSVAIAKMSDGSYFESHLHHCGIFRAFASQRRDYYSWGEGSREELFANNDERIQLLNRIEEEQDLKARVELMKELGFHPEE